MNHYQKLINDRADLCVKCGMCSSHCPTYQLANDENESPRGRISLMQALVNEQLPLSAPLQQHLDHCLGCRSCENVCPSGVAYSELIDMTQAYIKTHRPDHKLSARIHTGLIKLISVKRQPLQILSRLLRLYQKTGLQQLMRATRLLRYLGLANLEQLLPPIPKQSRWQTYYPPSTELQGEVALFVGCVTDILDKHTLQATIHLLNRIGYGVHIPTQQVCCGAMALHHGATHIATDCINTNIDAFADDKYTAILYLASGCGATLTEYHKISEYHNIHDTTNTINPNAKKVAAKVIDACEFLLNQPATATLPFQPLDKRIALHIPCTLRNVIKKPQIPHALLKLIPALNITTTNTQNLCCGAAGTHMVLQKKLADQLGQTMLAELLQTDVELLSTTNIGCYLHLRGLLQSSDNIPIYHPIALLNQQLLK